MKEDERVKVASHTDHGSYTAKTIYRNSKQIISEIKLLGLSLNYYTHVSVSDLSIPRIGLPILLQENRWTHRENM
jgi:hypothetical protein